MKTRFEPTMALACDFNEVVGGVLERTIFDRELDNPRCDIKLFSACGRNILDIHELLPAH